jgi:hypothetical protein
MPLPSSPQDANDFSFRLLRSSNFGRPLSHRGLRLVRFPAGEPDCFGPLGVLAMTLC